MKKKPKKSLQQIRTSERQLEITYYVVRSALDNKPYRNLKPVYGRWVGMRPKLFLLHELPG